MDFLEAIQEFATYLVIEKGASPHTVEAYRRDVTVFADGLSQQAINSWSLVQPTHMLAHLSRFKEAAYSSTSICRYLMSLKVFFKFLKREKCIRTDPALLVDSPKLWVLMPDILSCQEIDRLMEEPDTETKFGVRDKAILEVLYASGLRVSELCNLKLLDVDDIYVRVFGKGSKERIVPIGKKAVAVIDAYLHHRDDQLPQLFLNKKNKPISRIEVWKIVKQYVKQAGIQKSISPHSLRHAFATHLLDNDADLRVIQDMLGHASITSTNRYIHLSRAKIQNSFNQFSPHRAGPH